MCLQACKDGFRCGRRSFIPLDGCFFKGYYGGQLLVTVGIDTNDCIYPIAYATVESENFESWAWFLELLKEDLGINNSHHWTFMSDKQKVKVSFLFLLLIISYYKWVLTFILFMLCRD